MASISLPISRLINVSVTLTPQAAQGQNLSALLVLGTSGVIDVVTRIRSYTTIGQVAADFGTSAQEYLAAVLWFEQNPQPTQLYIGRWAQSASHGQLFGGALTTAQQAIGLWTTITNGSFHVTIDGGAPESITGLNFSAASNLNGVAAVIGAALTGCTIVWDSVYSRFEITSSSTGAASSVSFVTAGAGGTDISAMLNMLVSSSGAYVANGIVAESALAAVTIFDNSYGQQWFGLVVPSAGDSDHLAIAGYIEADTNKHFYGVTTQEAGVLTPGDTTDIAYKLQQLAYNFTATQYSSSNAYAVVSLLARILTTNYNANSSVITLMYKQEPGIVAENLNSTQIAALEAKNCNVFVAYNILTAGGANIAIIEQGVSASGNFIDTVIGSAALAIAIQTALFNLLYLSPTKIPQTDAGMHLLTTAIAAVCSQFQANGYLGSGTWTGQGAGGLNTGDTLAKGFYIYAPPLATQSTAARMARISVPIQIFAKLAGAVQTVNVSIIVNS